MVCVDCKKITFLSIILYFEIEESKFWGVHWTLKKMLNDCADVRELFSVQSVKIRSGLLVFFI